MTVLSWLMYHLEIGAHPEAVVHMIVYRDQQL